LAPIRNLPEELVSALTGKEGCLTCHKLRGVGASAYHVRASDGGANGARGLALEEYPSGVLWRFLIDQDAVAESFGVMPLHVGEAAAQALMNAALAPR